MFAFEKMLEIKGKIPFYKLMIDNVIQLDNFVLELKRNPLYYKEYVNILSWMEKYSNGNLVGKKKFRTLDDEKEPYVLFEFKSNNLRVYGMGRPGGELIIFGGYKNQQKKDIKKLRFIARELSKTRIRI